ncbi:hypothetical protein [Serratia sp. M24T3]|uniref:hypothetical protein n=1 Tax=Serratia sp. M24T3 TaxID=932213 RepID=UPI0002ED5884|nr:hypothetical protein [Serratia sp. M24T3]
MKNDADISSEETFNADIANSAPWMNEQWCNDSKWCLLTIPDPQIINSAPPECSKAKPLKAFIFSLLAFLNPTANHKE